MRTRGCVWVFVVLVVMTSLGLAAASCGDSGGCQDQVTTNIIPVLPPSSDGGVSEDAGDWIAAECVRRCPNPISCKQKDVSLEDGSSVTAIECVQTSMCLD